MVMGRLRLGQARIIEAVMAAILIFIAFTAAFFMLFSSEKFFKQETVDLNRLAYNVLHSLAESGIIDEVINETEINAERKLMGALQSLLPQNIYFNLTVYETASWSRVLSPISNAPPDVFEESGEVASAGITYTSKRVKKTYYLNLKLTRAGLT
ncbi:MAG: hypothetical protein QXL45_03755 [Candidatus Bathyarchaeia archaeon]